ncbi:hypothetical protein [Bradyrhizobium sp. Ec3.3]|uniref:hypothetical protein n=1 Tax=Bradyrhizobium sp. Ec3.3 TaxID=189753 RepID=UPI0004857F59|nr:hypothetical protein [Bradyrhizobium sp. Ec3.3]
MEDTRICPLALGVTVDPSGRCTMVGTAVPVGGCMALQERKPETDSAAASIVDEIEQEDLEAECKAEEAASIRESEDEAAEAEAILDGPPPDLPLTLTPPEPQRLEAGTEWAATGAFFNSVTNLFELRTKPAARFVGQCSAAELRSVSDFLLTVAAAERDVDLVRVETV